MSSLLDIIKNKLTDPAATQSSNLQTVPPVQPQAESLLRTKLTGKDDGSAGVPARSNIGEQLINQQGLAAQSQLQAQGAASAAQLGSQQSDIKNQLDISRQNEQAQRQAKQQQFQQQAQQIMSEAARSGKKLDTARDLDKLEQVGTAIRLNNEQYINQLQDVAFRQGITNDAAFKQQFYQQTFADSQDALQGNLSMQNIMAADDRAFTQAMAQISLEDALNVANTKTKEIGATAMFSGIGGLVQGGTQAANAYETGQERQQQKEFKDKQEKYILDRGGKAGLEEWRMTGKLPGN